jgi:NitT/TauT family transport system permease protein
VSRGRGARPALWAIGGVVVFAGAWEAWVRWRHVKPFITIAPSRIARELADHPRFWIDQSLTTAWHTLVGVALALGLAVAVGAVLAAVRPLEWAAQPILVLVMVTPWVAYITSVVLWLGLVTPTILFMVTFVTFPPFVFAAVQGLRSADVAAVELLASVDAGPGEVFWKLRLPSALPALFTALRFAAGLGLATAYFSEGGSSARPGSGLGEAGKRVTINATTGYPILWGSIVCAALLGVAFLVAVTSLERRVLGWHASQRTVPI